MGAARQTRDDFCVALDAARRPRCFPRSSVRPMRADAAIKGAANQAGAHPEANMFQEA